MDCPPRLIAIAQALYAQNPGLTTGSAEQQRLFIRLVAEQARFELGAAYGLKAAGPGRPQGPSEIAYAGGDPFGGWRLIDGDGSVTRVIGGILPNPPWQSFAGQLFLSADPIDHLKVSDTPTPALSPPSAVDLAPILARLAHLEETVNGLANHLTVVDSEAEEALHRPLPRYVARVFGITIVSRPEGS